MRRQGPGPVQKLRHWKKQIWSGTRTGRVLFEPTQRRLGDPGTGTGPGAGTGRPVPGTVLEPVARAWLSPALSSQDLSLNSLPSSESRTGRFVAVPGPVPGPVLAPCFRACPPETKNSSWIPIASFQLHPMTVPSAGGWDGRQRVGGLAWCMSFFLVALP